MRRDYDYFDSGQAIEDISLYENITIPAKVTIEEDKFIDHLLDIMEVSKPLNFEQEIIKGAIAIKADKQYERTLFGQMEQLIKSGKIVKAGNLNMIPIQTVSQRLKGLSNKYILI
jgi:hypothetical protein